MWSPWIAEREAVLMGVVQCELARNRAALAGRVPSGAVAEIPRLRYREIGVTAVSPLSFG